jgi:hypothetical protein
MEMVNIESRLYWEEFPGGKFRNWAITSLLRPEMKLKIPWHVLFLC